MADLPNSAKLIVLTGVDGSGKSTVLRVLSERFGANGRFWAVPRTYHGKSQDNSLPRYNYTAPQRPIFVSILKLFLRATEWFSEYHRTHRPVLRKGISPLFDRFYMDELLLDPRKYRYQAPEWLTLLVRRLLPTPDVYILLDAPSQVLFSRKQETSYDEVAVLREKYLNWVKQQPCAYIVDASQPLEKVIEDVYQIIQEQAAPE